MFCTIAPISPKIVLALLPNGYTGNIVNGEELRLGKISSAKDIMNFNIAALKVSFRPTIQWFCVNCSNTLMNIGANLTH